MNFRRILNRKLVIVASTAVMAALVIALVVAPAGAINRAPDLPAGDEVLNQPAPIPTMINYQGYLTDDSGNPINDTLQMTFSIYETAVGGTALWTETHPSVTVTDGLFNVLLGSVNPITVSELTGESYLGVKVGADEEMTPRQQIVSVAYAFVAERSLVADNASGLALPLSLELSYDGVLLGLTNPGGDVLYANAQNVAIDAINNSPDLPTISAENKGGGGAITGRNSSLGSATIDAENQGQGRAIVAKSNGVTQATLRAENQGGGPTLWTRATSAEFAAVHALNDGVADWEVGPAACVDATQDGDGTAIWAGNNSTFWATIEAENKGSGSVIKAYKTGDLHATIFAENGGDGKAIEADSTGEWPTVEAENLGSGEAYLARSYGPSDATIWAENVGGGPVLQINGTGNKILQAFDPSPNPFNPSEWAEVFHIHGENGGAGVYAFDDHVGIHVESELAPAFTATSDNSNAGIFTSTGTGCPALAVNQWGEGTSPAVHGNSIGGPGGRFETSTGWAAVEATQWGTGYSIQATGDVNVTGDIYCWDIYASNLKSAVVETPDYDWRRLYAVESTEVVFEDFGTAQMVTGYAMVEIEPIFAQTINTELPYQVFLTPVGDSQGLYVAEKTPTYFIVKENGGGTSTLSFDYRIVAKRKGYEEVRLEETEAPLEPPSLE